MNGVNAQRSNTATRVRRQCVSIFGVDDANIMRSEYRKEKFRGRIGWVTDGRGNGTYSSVDVEILHKNYSGEYNPSSAFLSPILMGVSNSIPWWSAYLDLNTFLAFYRYHTRTRFGEGIYDGHTVKPKDGNNCFHPPSS